MTISSNIGRFARSFDPITAKGPRNAHLNPEIALRAERLLKLSAREENEAFKVHPIYVCYYKRLTSGKLCTCRDEIIEADINKTKKTESIQLADFLINVPTLLKTKDSCPICFDNRFIGGYNRVGAYTIVLDGSNKMYDLKGLRIEKSRPYIFRANNKEGYVAWKVKLPKYYDKVLDAAVSWEEKPKSWKLEIEGVELNKDTLVINSNKEVEIRLYMKDGNNKKAGAYCIFLILQISNSLIPSNFPNITTSLTADFNIINEVSSPQSVYFDNTIKLIETTDLFIDTRYKRLWRVLEIEHNSPYENPIDWKTQSRLIRDFEVNYMIPNKILLEKYPISNRYSFIV